MSALFILIVKSTFNLFTLFLFYVINVFPLFVWFSLKNFLVLPFSLFFFFLNGLLNVTLWFFKLSFVSGLVFFFPHFWSFFCIYIPYFVFSFKDSFLNRIFTYEENYFLPNTDQFDLSSLDDIKTRGSSYRSSPIAQSSSLFKKRQTSYGVDELMYFQMRRKRIYSLFRNRKFGGRHSMFPIYDTFFQPRRRNRRYAFVKRRYISMGKRQLFGRKMARFKVAFKDFILGPGKYYRPFLRLSPFKGSDVRRLKRRFRRKHIVHRYWDRRRFYRHRYIKLLPIDRPRSPISFRLRRRRFIGLREFYKQSIITLGKWEPPPPTRTYRRRISSNSDFSTYEHYLRSRRLKVHNYYFRRPRFFLRYRFHPELWQHFLWGRSPKVRSDLIRHRPFYSHWKQSPYRFKTVPRNTKPRSIFNYGFKNYPQWPTVWRFKLLDRLVANHADKRVKVPRLRLPLGSRIRKRLLYLHSTSVTHGFNSISFSPSSDYIFNPYVTNMYYSPSDPVYYDPTRFKPNQFRKLISTVLPGRSRLKTIAVYDQVHWGKRFHLFDEQEFKCYPSSRRDRHVSRWHAFLNRISNYRSKRKVRGRRPHLKRDIGLRKRPGRLRYRTFLRRRPRGRRSLVSFDRYHLTRRYYKYANLRILYPRIRRRRVWVGRDPKVNLDHLKKTYKYGTWKWVLHQRQIHKVRQKRGPKPPPRHLEWRFSKAKKRLRVDLGIYKSWPDKVRENKEWRGPFPAYFRKRYLKLKYHIIQDELYLYRAPHLETWGGHRKDLTFGRRNSNEFYRRYLSNFSSFSRPTVNSNDYLSFFSFRKPGLRPIYKAWTSVCKAVAGRPQPKGWRNQFPFYFDTLYEEFSLVISRIYVNLADLPDFNMFYLILNRAISTSVDVFCMVKFDIKLVNLNILCDPRPLSCKVFGFSFFELACSSLGCFLILFVFLILVFFSMYFFRKSIFNFILSLSSLSSRLQNSFDVTTKKLYSIICEVLLIFLRLISSAIKRVSRFLRSFIR